MILGVMQPYLLPYFEHFRLIASCNRWVVFDIAQFTRKTWVTRNRILNREKGTSYLSVPVRHTGLATRLKDAEIDSAQDWRKRLLDQLLVYRKEAPHFRVTREFIGDTLAHEYLTIADLNTSLLRAVCSRLGIDTRIDRCSELKLDLPSHCEPGEWALHISRALGAAEYRNPAGGRELFNAALYSQHGIELRFHEHRPRSYPTGTLTFVADLSVVDWLMWNDLPTLQEWLH